MQQFDALFSQIRAIVGNELKNYKDSDSAISV